MLLAIVSKRDKITRYHVLTMVDIDSHEASTRITVSGELDTKDRTLSIRDAGHLLTR